MLLVIPRIDIRDERCVFTLLCSRPEPPHVFDDPISMGRLWRLQNARSLHIVDQNRRQEPTDDTNAVVLRRLCDSLDIPIQLEGGLLDRNNVRLALELGAYRVIPAVRGQDDVDFIEGCIRDFGAHRIVARTLANTEDLGVVVASITGLEAVGCRRFIVSSSVQGPDGDTPIVDMDLLKACSDALSKAKITVGEGLNGYTDLLAIQEADRQIDSVILGRSLYNNLFPCQQMWCWHDKNSVDLHRVSTADLRKSS